MDFRLLGPLEVRDDNGPLPLGGSKQRALLALLLLYANRVVSRERLIDELWGDDPPHTAVASVQVYVSRLRKLLPQGRLETRPPGYLLRVEPDELDIDRFERLCAAGRRREALELWQGSPLAEFEEPFAKVEAGRLEELRLVALEERIEADLTQGRHADLAGELEALIADNPHRERLRAQLMLALYRSGRQTDALATYREGRAALGELGLDPSAELKRLQRQILSHDTALDLAAQALLADERAPLPGALVPESPFPFVGRANELEMLRSLLERALRGEGCLVLLSGEPGAGKTRLVRELAQDAAERGVVVCYGTSDAAVTVPYQPLLEWFEFLRRACDLDGLAAVAANGAALAPVLPGVAHANPAEPPPDRFRLQSAVTDVLRTLAEAKPLLLVMEDIHWSDGETLALLVRLARAAPEVRMLVLATFRQPGEEIQPELRDALGQLARIEVPRLSLDNLTQEEVAAFVRRSTDAEASTELLTAIIALTDGTPLLVCELWRDLVASGAIEVDDGRVMLVRPVSEIRGPRRIHDLIEQRLALLPREAASMVETASVTGPRFELRVVGIAAGLDHGELASAVEQTVSSGIVEELPATMPACRFTHELIRRAIYDRIPRVRLPELHLRVGEALEHVYAPYADAVVPDLAHHFTLAAPIDGAGRAVRYNLRAAEAARDSVAYDEAIARLSTALELGIDDPRERTRVQSDLGYLLHESGRVAEAMALWAASAAAATTLEDRGLATRALVQSARAQLYHDPVGRSAEMLPVAEEAIATFTQLGDRRGLATAVLLFAEALGREQRHAEGFAALDRALALAQAIGDRVLRRDIIGQIARRLCDGPIPAGEAIERLEALRSVENDPVHDAAMRRCLAFALAMVCRFDESRAHLDASSVPLDQVDRTSFSFSSHWMAARAKELAGDLAGAEQELIAPFWRYRDARGDEPESRAMRAAALLALLYEDQGRWDEAAEYLAYGQEVDRSPPAKGKIYTPLRLAARARLATHQGRLPEALEIAQIAVDLFGRGEWLNDVTPAWLALAAARRANGQPAEADAAFAEAIRLYQAKGNIAALSRLTAPTRTA
jgi:DNA-binding SARP family transcriptional activator